MCSTETNALGYNAHDCRLDNKLSEALEKTTKPISSKPASTNTSENYPSECP